MLRTKQPSDAVVALTNLAKTHQDIRTSAGVPDTISLLLTPNANYAQHAAACIAAVLGQTGRKLDVVIASTDNPELFAERVRRSFASSDRVRLEFRHFTVPTDGRFPVTHKLSIDTYLRFWVRELMPGRSRVLYLDPDIIAIGPLEELWTVPLGTNVLAAVPIPNSSRVSEHNMPEGSLFFNAGVLVIDVDAWEQRHYRDRCINYLIKHPERALDADQDILNLVLIGDWLPLDYKWNLINPFWRRHANSHDLKMTEAEVRTILADARLVHFNGQHKPWFYMDNHPRRQDYFDALAQTDWRGWQPPDRTALNMLRKGLSRALPTWVKEAGRAMLSRTKVSRRD